MCKALSHDVLTHLPQLLYSRELISEASLDEIVERNLLHDKRTTNLLTALQETVSSDYRKFKDIATALFGVKETRDIANEMLKEYSKLS